MRRYEARWKAWEEAVDAGEKPVDFIPKLTDAVLIQLLAAGDPTSRRYEVNLIATEMLNRLARFRRIAGEAIDEAGHQINLAAQAAESAAEATGQTEQAVRSHHDTRHDMDGEPALASAASQAVRATVASIHQAREATRELESVATQQEQD